MSVLILSTIFLSVLVRCIECSSNSVATTQTLLGEKGSELQSSMLQSSGSYADQPLVCSEKLEESCPPGLFCKHGHCQCAKEYPHNFITCNGTRSFLASYFCVTYDEDKHLVGMGSCHRYYKNNKSRVFLPESIYQPLPRYPEELNNASCNLMRRTGILCGRCLPDHYPLAYSYNITCIPCPHARWNWFRYIMAAYLPLTLFYIILVFLRINITTSHLFTVVYFCQTLTMPLLLRNILIVATNNNTGYITVVHILIALYGVWNLDFFRSFYFDLCLGLDVLPTLALDYAIAAYPLLLMIITYLLVVLHDRNYRVITIIWKPFRVLCSLFRRNWNVRTSIIDAFATFFFLSNIKFLSVSFDFLIPTQVFWLYPDHYNYTLGLYYAGDIEYFGREHLPYAILAIIVLCVFVLLPSMVLALYPFSLFQRFLNLFPFRWHILHTFMDSFHGCYKDGTEPGTRDYRWCVSVFFLSRVIQLFLYFMSNKEFYNILVTVLLVLVVTLFAILRPFKDSLSHYNTINIFFIQCLLLFSVVASGGFQVVSYPGVEYFFYSVATLLCIIPVPYILASICFCLYKRRIFSSCNFVQRFRARQSEYARLPGYNTEKGLPDRIENSADYPKENLSNFS